MNLSNDIYLRSAFRELDAFAIAGIGTFRKIYHAAREESFSGEFLPPSVSIEFVPEVDESLLLEHYLMQTIHLEKQTALHMTQDIRKSILTSLATQGVYEISGIGHLRRESGGTILFFPVNEQESFFSGDFYGLQPLKLTEKEEETRDQPISDSIMQEEHRPQVSEFSRKYRIDWKAPAILGIVALFALYLIGMEGPMRSKLRRASLVENVKVRNMGLEDQFLADNLEPLPQQPIDDPFQDPFEQPDVRSEEPTDFDTPNESSSDAQKFNPIASNEQVQPESSAPSQGEAQPASPPSQTETLNNRSSTTRGVTRGGEDAQEEVFIPQSNVSALAEDPFPQKARVTGIYHVISGSFRQLRDAQKVVEDMQGKGYDAQVLTSSPTIHRVSVFRSHERTEAERFAAQLKSRGVPKSWIFHDRY